MTESPVDVAAIKADHVLHCTDGHGGCLYTGGLNPRNRPPCDPYRLADALDRAQAASEGVDMLIAQAERRGAVKALRTAASATSAVDPRPFLWLNDRADAIENGADL